MKALIRWQIKHRDIGSHAVKTQTFKVPQLPPTEKSQIQVGTKQLPMEENLQNAAAVPPQMLSKRKTTDEEHLEPHKRMKISVGTGISLEDY